jgi:predicted TIM-barrel fold metal-dependent hydrolase
VYSTDYPHEVDADTCKHELEELQENPELTAVDKEAILFRNAQRFYQLAQQ